MEVFKKVCLLGLIFWSHLALSQTFTNPLDIEGREPNVELLQDSTFQDAFQNLQGNPSIENNAARADNPFDVSHIPLKKTATVTSSQTRPKRTSNNSSSKSKTSKAGLSNFLLWILIALLVYFAGIMFLFREEVFNLIKPLFNLNYLKSYNREASGGRKPLFLSLYVFFIFNIGLLIYGLTKDHIAVYSGINLLWFLVLTAFGIYLFKHTYIYIIKWVFPLQTSLSHYGFTVVLLNAVVGVLLFPVNIMAVLGPENWSTVFMGLGILILLVFYFIRLIKGFQLSARKSSNNIFHFFLYLCGSEIAPIALVYGFINHGF